MSRQEVLKLLEKAAEYCRCDISVPDADGALPLIVDAIVLLRAEEPEAGEFTKRVRTEPYNPKWKHTVIIRTEDRDKLCDIIDRQSAELKKLLKEKE